MRKLFTVLRQEYLLKVRTKAFLFGTFVLPVLMAALMILPSLFMSMAVNKPTTLAVVDPSGLLLEPLTRNLSETSKSGQRLYSLVSEVPAGRSPDQLVRDLGPQVLQEKLGGFLILPPDVLEGGQSAFYAKNVSDPTRNRTMENALGKSVREIRIRRSGIDTSKVALVLKDVPMTTFKVKEGGGASRDRGATFILAYIVGIFFYMSMLIYGAMMLRASLEEKTSRSAEAMISVVRPTVLMGGKILGIGLTALTQMAIWGGILGLVSLYMAASSASFLGGLDLSAITLTLPMILLFLVYFIMGFLLYAGLFAALGAMVNSESEAQQLQMTINLPAVMSFMLMFMAIRAPNGTLVQVCSLIPLFAPILMTVRICVVMPPVWEIALSLVLLGAALVGVIWVAGRIFRVGLLMYGKRPNLPELMKWIRYG